MDQEKSALPHQRLSQRQAEFVAASLRDYSGSDRETAIRHSALPLYRGWTHIRASLVRAAALRNEMKTLIPEPPSDSIKCDMCDGTGTIQIPGFIGSRIICQCGGFGWLDPPRSDRK